MRTTGKTCGGTVLAAVLLLAVAGPAALGFVPSGWCYHQWPHLYPLSGGAWVYVDESSGGRIAFDFLADEWTAWGGAQTGAGWVFYEWPFGYVLDTGAWHYIDETAEQWCYHFGEMTWSGFGIPSAGPSGWRPMPEYERDYVEAPSLGQNEYSVFVEGYGDMTFLLHLPANYHDLGKWPTILFLHGSEEAGTDTTRLRSVGLPGYVGGVPDFPFIVVTPQLRSFQWWDPAQVDQVLTHVVRHYRVDQERMAVSGLSLGGYGTWSMATAYPYRFSAAVPIAGGGDPGTVCAIAHLPVWVFHGDRDPSVPLSEAQAMVDALQACGGNVRFTIYPDTGHDSWTATYANPEVHAWIADQVRVGP